MFRMSLFVLILGLSASNCSFQQACAEGQAKESGNDKAKAVAAEKQQFLLYAIENLSLQLPEELVIPTAKPSGGRGRRTNSPTDGIAAFVRQQELVFDTLRRHIEKEGDKNLQALLPLYRKQLDEYGIFNTEIQKATVEFQKKIAIQGQVASTNVMLSGVGYALYAVAEGNNNDEVITRSAAGMFATALEEGKELKRYTKAESQQFADLYQHALDESKKRIAAARKEFDQKLKSLMVGTNAEGKNPFRVVNQAQAVLKKTDATWQEFLEQTQVCQSAVKMVPEGGDVFDLYRAAFLGAAGVLANAASIKDCGTTGIPLRPKDVPAAGVVARGIWNTYLKVEYNPKRPTRKDFSDEFFQAFVLARAYAGEAGDEKKSKELYEMLINPQGMVLRRSVSRVKGNITIFYTLRKEFSSRPEFWFDCARIASVLGDTSLALECLYAAVAQGFRDGVEAKSSVELRNVRENPRTSAKFASLFP